MLEGSTITAALGPTNTGKTHRAVERLLSHETGMIGLPLRLLAREVYDRITPRVGEGRVALVTGEEKRIPKRPDYWVCTVESMPMDREVDFVAVDEIQLAAHPRRGHVFTDRLLHARGRRETFFLGSDTMRPLVSELCPTAQVTSYPRLSKLTFSGAEKLTRLPPRSAVIGFSAAQVYAIAERLRALKGGAAVVLGALSPRTRNAQVALFEAGEVDYLVATDAIGMGLNLDLGHVAFASRRKFDGRLDRELDVSELAQIAGRAGRYLRDGTFGTVLPEYLTPDVAMAIEGHHFPPVRRAFYRSTELDFGSIEALVASLGERPKKSVLRLVEEADDTNALLALADDAEVRARATSPERVELLWEACRIPDYKKLLLGAHAELCREVFLELSGPRKSLDDDFMAERLEPLEKDPAGDVDSLMARLAAVRTSTYVSHQGNWVRNAREWQERARALEDKLSELLHEALVQRFVEQGGKPHATSRKRGSRKGQRGAGDDVLDTPPGVPKGHPFAGLARMRAQLAGRSGPSGPGARGSLGEEAELAVWVEDLVGASFEAFEVDEGARVTFGGEPIARLVKGRGPSEPDLRLTIARDLGAGAKARVLRRMQAWARDFGRESIGPLAEIPSRELSAAGRGLAYQLEQGLGTALSAAAAEQIAGLTSKDRELFEAASVVLGARVVYAQRLLDRASLERRLLLARLWFGVPLTLPPPGAVSFRAPRGDLARALLALGYPVFGVRAIRADVVERVQRALGEVSEEEDRPAFEGRLASWMGCPAREVSGIAAAINPSA